jgi:hypothetical protein
MTLDLSSILISFESTLRIEHTETDAEKIIRNSKAAIEAAYQVKLDDTVYAVQARSSFVSDSLDLFLAQLKEPVRELAFFTVAMVFFKRSPISLRDVNYLGFAEETLRKTLKYLQDANLYEHRGKFIPAYRQACGNLDWCDEKRLFVVLLVLEALGIKEAVAVAAYCLYAGGLAL